MSLNEKDISITNESVKCFSGRAQKYDRYRAAYPDSLIDFLVAECGLGPGATVADLGSGTGTLTCMLLERGNSVFAIEPNPDMRRIAEYSLNTYEGFHSIAATAEATTLPDSSVDLITVGRAMQWFDADSALKEMRRILKPLGCAAVIWNIRKRPLTNVLSAYKHVLRSHCPGFDAVARNRRAAVDLLQKSGLKVRDFEYQQQLDLNELKGLVLSLSIAPNESDPRCEMLMSALEGMFFEHNIDGYLVFDYMTTIYYGYPGPQSGRTSARTQKIRNGDSYARQK
jgi:ubiquinone/menaquinone biosynthesis C-methylase UbiE